MKQLNLIPRHAGAKSNGDKYPVWDGRTYDLAYVPFAGSGRWCIPAFQRGHVRGLSVADADPATRAVWDAYAGVLDRRDFDECVEAWVTEFYLAALAADAGKAVKLFKDLCSIHDGTHDFDYDRYDYAVAKILLHKLCFGGNVRSNSQGKLNISLRADWVEAIQGYKYELPWCPPGRTLRIYDDWSKCFDVESSGKTIAFIDPPYYAPGNGPRVKGGMSKCYSVHGGSPNNSAVLDLFTGAVAAAIDKGCDLIVATNYWGHWLETIQYSPEGQPTVIEREWVEYAETTDFMRAQGFEWFHDLGPLQAMNNRDFNPAKAGTTEQRTIRHEGWWEMGGARQHGRVEQINLFEVAA